MLISFEEIKHCTKHKIKSSITCLFPLRVTLKVTLQSLTTSLMEDTCFQISNSQMIKNKHLTGWTES